MTSLTNMTPAQRSARGRKGKKASPWAKGPAVNSTNARRVFAKPRKPKEGGKDDVGG